MWLQVVEIVEASGPTQKGSIMVLFGWTDPKLEKSPLFKATEQSVFQDALLCMQIYPGSASLVGLLASPPLFPYMHMP